MAPGDDNVVGAPSEPAAFLSSGFTTNRTELRGDAGRQLGSGLLCQWPLRSLPCFCAGKNLRQRVGNRLNSGSEKCDEKIRLEERLRTPQQHWHIAHSADDEPRQNGAGDRHRVAVGDGTEVAAVLKRFSPANSRQPGYI